MSGLALAFGIWLAGAGAPAGGDCPTSAAVSAEVQRLGALDALARVGSTDVTAGDGGDMRIVLRARDGLVLGTRRVAAPASCQERAMVAAVVIATWLGEWGRAASPRATVAEPARVVALAPSPSPSSPVASAPWRGELSAFAFGAHDGDAGALGLGVEGSLGLGPVLSVSGLAERTGERSRPLGPGEATYSSLRFGLGLLARRAFGRGFGEVGLFPEAERFSLQGQGLANARGATAWSAAAGARLRIGVRLGAVAPFVYAGISYALTGQRLTLDDRPITVSLSAWGVAAGAGLLVPFGPLGG